jgi:hypothetical protein
MASIFYFIRRMHSPRAFALFLCTLAVLLASATTASAQEQTGVLVGEVLDQLGAPMSGARVVAIDIERNIKFSGTSDKNGTYHLTNLPIGHYQLIASAKGWPTTTTSIFTLSFHQVAEVNFVMYAGSRGDHEIDEMPFLPPTSSSELKITNDAYAIERLPL